MVEQHSEAKGKKKPIKMSKKGRSSETPTFLSQTKYQYQLRKSLPNHTAVNGQEADQTHMLLLEQLNSIRGQDPRMAYEN